MDTLLKELVELNEAIEAYEYLETFTTDEKILEESLQLHILKNNISKIFQIPIGKIFFLLLITQIYFH